MPRKKTTKWLKEVEENKRTLPLPEGLFERDPKGIARGLKNSVVKARKAKANQFKSAMAMLTFYINRTGKRLTRTDKARLEKAKVELRKLFNKD